MALPASICKWHNESFAPCYEAPSGPSRESWQFRTRIQNRTYRVQYCALSFWQHASGAGVLLRKNLCRRHGIEKLIAGPPHVVHCSDQFSFRLKLTMSTRMSLKRLWISLHQKAMAYIAKNAELYAEQPRWPWRSGEARIVPLLKMKEVLTSSLAFFLACNYSKGRLAFLESLHFPSRLDMSCAPCSDSFLISLSILEKRVRRYHCTDLTRGTMKDCTFGVHLNNLRFKIFCGKYFTSSRAFKFGEITCTTHSKICVCFLSPVT